jgi:hypothetical protein
VPLQQQQLQLQHDLQVLKLSSAWGGLVAAALQNQQQLQPLHRLTAQAPNQPCSAAVRLLVLPDHSQQLLLLLQTHLQAEACSIQHLPETRVWCSGCVAQPSLLRCAAAGDLLGRISYRCCSC